MKKLVSIVVPVYNVEQYLNECMDSLLGQTYENVEVICVDDGSTDTSLGILETYAKKDARVQILTQQNKGAGAARNYGMSKAKGEYLYFFDSDDIADETLLEKTVAKAEELDADIVAFHGYTFENDDISTKKKKNGYNGILSEDTGVFSYKDFPKLIFGIINVVPWNKLIRRKFVVEKNIRFEEISSTNDITFAAMCAASAERIAVVEDILMYYRIGHGGTVSSTKQKNLKNVITAVESVISQAQSLEYYEEIKPALLRFVMDNYSFSFLKYTKDFTTDVSKMFYEFIHERFNSELFDGVTAEMIDSRKHFAMFQSIRKHTYEEMALLRNRDVVISLTSFPGRITAVSTVIENMLQQSRKADKILLYLAKQQFPKGEKDLPEELIYQMETGALDVVWCDEDIRSHKKYYYAMQQYPDSLIITVDDDLKYPLDMVENLYYSYLCHPDCVSAMRAHIVAVDTEAKEVLPYEFWVKEYREYMLEPSYQLCATSGAGTLYPPNALNKRVFDKEKFMEICPLADDLWLNIMQIVNGTATVCATTNFVIRMLENTQEESLFAENVGEGKNTSQYCAIKEWLETEYGYDIVYEAVSRPTGLATYLGVRRIFEYVQVLQQYELSRRRKLGASVKKKNAQIARLQVKLKKAKKKVKKMSKNTLLRRLLRKIKRLIVR